MEYSLLMKDINVRKALPADHINIVSVMKKWWDGRDLTSMLPKVFLNHFHNSSFIAEKDHELLGFLVGFLSQAQQNEAYIHFVGVHPDYRKIGLGAMLYNMFFDLCQQENRHIVRACTSPVNKGSIQFHQKMGFQIDAGDSEIDGIPVTNNYNREGDPKVLFTKYLSN